MKKPHSVEDRHLPFPSQSEQKTRGGWKEAVANGTHSVVKNVGLLGGTVLEVAENLRVTSSGVRQEEGTGWSQGWQGRAVPYVHEKVDALFSTNLKEKFDPKKDSIPEKILQGVLLNPLPVAEGAVSMAGSAARARQAPAATSAAAKTAKVLTPEAAVISKEKDRLWH